MDSFVKLAGKFLFSCLCVCNTGVITPEEGFTDISLLLLLLVPAGESLAFFVLMARLLPQKEV